MLDRIYGFFDWLYTFFTHDIWVSLKEGLLWLVGKLIIGYYEAKFEMMKLAWGTAKGLITELNISGHIVDSITALPPDYVQLIAYCRLPEACNIILAGFLTRFMLKFVPI